MKNNKFSNLCLIIQCIVLAFTIIPTLANAKEFAILAEITPPYAYRENNRVVGIYKDILDFAFKHSGHTYILNAVNSRSLITAIENDNFDAVIGISKFSKYFSKLKDKISVGLIPINAITASDHELFQPYTQSLSSKRVGAVYGVGFKQLLPQIKLETYKYAQQGVIELLNNKLDVIIEDPLIIKCVSSILLIEEHQKRSLYVHSPPISRIEIFLGISEGNQQVIDLLNKSIQTVNLDRLSKKYSQYCDESSSLVFHNNLAE
jgi:ABC-type amino acid transport substrate-binding protein